MNLKVLIKDHFAPGIHLYYFEWNKLAYDKFNLYGSTIGPLADEIEKVYPDIIDNHMGFKRNVLDNLNDHENYKFKYLLSHIINFNINYLSNKIGLKLDNSDNNLIEPYNNYDTFSRI
jgi:hypothetical protein